jgi:hypothetical protein
MKQRSSRQTHATLGDEEDFPQVVQHQPETFTRTTVEQSLVDMQKIEDEISFFQDVIEEIKSLTEYHVLPIAEHITPKILQQFIETAKSLTQ